MEPVTHFLTGACLARSGFNRKTAYATLAMTLAAEAPDLDILWSLRGPVAGFEHHRGITHTLIGAPFVALAVTGVVYLWHRFRRGKKESSAVGEHPHGVQQPRWLLIWLFSLVAALSHLLLDFTNNYGLRPFFPFNPKWYSWDIVFIFEPLILVALVGALVMPALFGLADSEIGARRKPFRGRGWAIAALVAMALIYVVRNAEHQRALNLMRAANLSEPTLRVAAEPYPGNPFHWMGIAETADFYQVGSIDTRADSVDTDPNDNVFYKPPVTMATLAAKRSWLGRAYLDWSRWPLVTDLGSQPAPGASAIEGLPAPLPSWRTVEFRDLRFSSFILLGRGKTPPLSGWVYIGPGPEVEAMIFGSREQK
jgi:inner membrane protein